MLYIRINICCQNSEFTARYQSIKILETSIVKNYEMIEGAQFSNSFIILMALNESNKPLNSTEISEIIALKTSGKIFKVSATLKDSLEHRLKAWRIC